MALSMSNLPVGLGAVGLAIAIYIYYKKLKADPQTAAVARPAKAKDVVEENAGPKIEVYFGSQTGTAEEFSKILSQEGRKYGLQMKPVDLEKFDPIKLKGSTSIFLVATYGEGDPTDNARSFHRWLVESAEEGALEGTQFAVFALGNMQYEHYNSFGKLVDQECARLGGQRIFDIGLGDDDKNIQEDFEVWKEQLFPALQEHFGLVQSSSAWAKEGVSYKYKVTVHATEAEARAAARRAGAAAPAEPHAGALTMTVTCNRELYRGGDRSCRHLELDITGTAGARFETGDHVAVYPENDPELVRGYAQRVGADLSAWMVVEDGEGGAPLPQPCGVEAALSRHLDLNHPPSKSLLVALAEGATDAEERGRLVGLAEREGKDACYAYVVAGRRTALDVLREHPSVRLSLAQLVELMPRLQPRYYSISSASVVTPGSVHVTAAVVREALPDGRTFKGVCTNYLAPLQPGAAVRGFLRATPFKLPAAPSTPVILIGAGTGLAPLRGMYLHLDWLRRGGATLGHNVLIFGCRRRDEDLLYAEEIDAMRASGTLSSVHLALSRADPFKKVYVQNRVDECGVQLLRLLDDGAHIYVCGSVNMARDVRKALLQSLIFLRGKSGPQAEGVLETLAKEGRYLQDVW